MALGRRLDNSLYSAALGPPWDGEAVASLPYTPSDGGPFASLWVSVSGAIAIVTMAGNTVTIPAVPIGRFEMPGKQVLASGTTATITHAFVR